MKKYFVTSGDWNRKVTANSYMEAATVAVEKIFKTDENVSFGAVVGVVEERYLKQKNTDRMRYIYGPTVLANAGQYALANQLKINIDKMKKSL